MIICRAICIYSSFGSCLLERNAVQYLFIPKKNHHQYTVNFRCGFFLTSASLYPFFERPIFFLFVSFAFIVLPISISKRMLRVRTLAKAVLYKDIISSLLLYLLITNDSQHRSFQTVLATYCLDCFIFSTQIQDHFPNLSLLVLSLSVYLWS